jgi:6-phosphogluconolactonase (cycloisomerase 2 family)
MKWFRSSLLAASGTVALMTALPAVSAAAATPSTSNNGGARGASNAVFVQTNDPTGNTILAYHRANDGILTPASSYPTGGLGGTATGAPVDALASQGSLVYDSGHGLLLAVNAGSDSITVFRAHGDHLVWRQVISSDGQFPVSIAVHGNLAYVLDAGGQGTVAGYRIDDGRLDAISGSARSLSLGNTTPPVFISAPAQVGFDPTGSDLVVTTKNHNAIDVFGVRHNGSLSAAPVVSPSAGPVPFGFSWDRSGNLLVTEAGTGTVTAYRIGAHRSLHVLSRAAANGQAALCWFQGARGFFYGANAGSASISSYRSHDGTVALVAAVSANTSGGSIDMSASEGGRFLYVQNSGAGTVQGFRVGKNGGLTLVTTVTGLPVFNTQGMEGIAAI